MRLFGGAVLILPVMLVNHNADVGHRLQRRLGNGSLGLHQSISEKSQQNFDRT